MLSLRSLALILASAIRRARAMSCASFQCFPDIIENKIATKIATKIASQAAAAIVPSPMQHSTPMNCDDLPGRKDGVRVNETCKLHPVDLNNSLQINRE